MISDASYSYNTKCAGLGVIDLHSNKKYSQSIQGVKDSHNAEYKALLLSVSIALKNNYNNVVFVYDNKTLDLEPLKIWLNGKIDIFQFLWLKRNYLQNADEIARKARKLQEQLYQLKQKTPQKKSTSTSNNQLNDHQIIQAIRYYHPKKIANFCLTIASNKEKKLVNNYFNGKKPIEYIPTKNGVNTLIFLCYLFPKKMRQDFFLYIKDNIKGNKYHSKVRRDKPMPFYIKRLHQVIDKLQKEKKYKN